MTVFGSRDISAALRGLGVTARDTLYVHSDVSRCVAAQGRTRTEKLDTVLDGLLGAVPDGRLMIPTYTYSFCHGEPYDPAATPSTVGVLSEHARRRPGARRTMDPLFSCAVLGARMDPVWEQRLFTVGPVDCWGETGTFAFLAQTDAIFAFLGVPVTTCTFVHHAEQRAQVAYRFSKSFDGVVVRDGMSTRTTATFYARDLEAEGVETDLVPLADDLRARGLSRSTTVPHGPVVTVARARDIAEQARLGLRENPDYLLVRGRRGAMASRAA